MNAQTLTDAKRAVREMENLDRDHERLWRREDELITHLAESSKGRAR